MKINELNTQRGYKIRKTAWTQRSQMGRNNNKKSIKYWNRKQKAINSISKKQKLIIWKKNNKTDKDSQRRKKRKHKLVMLE